MTVSICGGRSGDSKLQLVNKNRVAGIMKMNFRMRSEVAVAHSVSSVRHRVIDGLPVHPAGPPANASSFCPHLRLFFRISFFGILFSLLPETGRPVWLQAGIRFAAPFRKCRISPEKHSPLGNAAPEDLAWESTNLLRPYGRLTGEIRNVDGGYHIRG